MEYGLSVPDEEAFSDKIHTTTWLWEQDNPHRATFNLFTGDTVTAILVALKDTYPDLRTLTTVLDGSIVSRVIVEIPAAAARVAIGGTGMHECRYVSIYGGQPLDRIISWFAGRYDFHAPPPPPSDKIAVRFTHMDTHGYADGQSRNITASAWPDITRNYSSDAAAKISDWLIGLSAGKITGGKIAVLHGPPGTGKTHLIRSLIREWKPWARASYIMDVNNFFRQPGYMLGVLLDDFAGDKWNVIICEDSEEYISPEAKSKVGQGLSQLLNAGDGMIGQGLRVLFLFTTNAAGVELHPAIIRPGRCFANIEVPRLNATEASAWLGETVTEDMSLAECYEKKNPTMIKHALAVAAPGQYL